MDDQVQKLDIGKWIEEELRNLTRSEIESLANEELEKLKDFVSPDIYSFVVPDSISAVQEVSSSSEATSSFSSASISAAKATSNMVDGDRFGKAISENELKTAIEKRVRTNKKKTTNWGLNIWREWCQCRGINHAGH